VGEAEAAWVERAEKETVRALQAAVRQAGRAPEEVDEPWMRLCAEATPEDRQAIDEALALAGRILPGSSRIQQFEALAQEFLGQFGGVLSEDAKHKLSTAFHPLGPAPEVAKASLEGETERWSMLPPIPGIAVPDVTFDETSTAEEIHAHLRALVALRAGWDDVIGFCAHAIQQSGIYRRYGFASFRHYCEERLGLPVSTVEERAALEKRLWQSPALQEARRQGLSFDKLRALSRLPEAEIGSWGPRAHALTCIALRRRLEAAEDTRMCAARKVSARLPLRVVTLLDGAIQTVREAARGLYSVGTCLAVIARHFIDTWKGAIPRETPSQKLRARDGDWCTVPGCSHRSTDEHHVLYRSQGGGDEPENKTGVCGYHHHRCLHAGHVKVWGRAPDGLTWMLGKEGVLR
jgi:hypothetical protein